VTANALKCACEPLEESPMTSLREIPSAPHPPIPVGEQTTGANYRSKLPEQATGASYRTRSTNLPYSLVFSSSLLRRRCWTNGSRKPESSSSLVAMLRTASKYVCTQIDSFCQELRLLNGTADYTYALRPLTSIIFTTAKSLSSIISPFINVSV
jgi:hypothetical protein